MADCPCGHVTAPTSTVSQGFSKLDSSEQSIALTIPKMLHASPSDVVVWHQLSASIMRMTILMASALRSVWPLLHVNAFADIRHPDAMGICVLLHNEETHQPLPVGSQGLVQESVEPAWAQALEQGWD